MRKYGEKISDNSVWVTFTPPPVAVSLPFYAMEAGHFEAEREYVVERSGHDSYLLLYTINGCGKIITGDTEMDLDRNSAVVIDCRKQHKYFSESEEWEFFWLHFNGASAAVFLEILYPFRETAVKINDREMFCEKISTIIDGGGKNDVSSVVELSVDIHDIFRILINSAIEKEQRSRRNEYEEDIARAVDFIKTHYGDNITIDDMIEKLHISKYHFIRLFGRIMGTTPYSYLTMYRINTSKIFLRTTDKSISEIAEMCGFPDTSNFINHFKKRTGQRPAQYRRDFA